MTTASQTTIGCVKAATEILGDKWTPQLLRFLANESSVRFCQLQDLAGGVNPRTLSSRLLTLERQAVIEKSSTSSGNRFEYSLTQKGRDLLPILQGMQAWGDKYTHNND